MKFFIKRQTPNLRALLYGGMGFAILLEGGVKESFAQPSLLETSTNSSQKEAVSPVLLEADEVTVDESLSTTTARGNVSITSHSKSGTTILQADTVTFNEKTHLATATGNVLLFEANGDIYKAHYIEITDDLKQGLIKTVGLLTKDNRRISALSAEKKEEKVTTFEKAVYSPCNLCKENPENPPLWQVKAMKVIRDETKGDVDYHDVWMEFAGTPIFYTPYLSHPDPTVKRRSGFLVPYFGVSKDLGMMTGIPYYHVINDSQDMTLTPLFLTKESPVLIGEYRQRFSNGAFEALGSITDSKKPGSAQNAVEKSKKVRGHIQSKGILNLNDSWRTGFTVNRASDQTYVRRYSFTNVESPQTASLDSTAYAEGFYDKNYALIQGYAFQPTRLGQSQKTSPLILPVASYNYVGHQREEGDHFFSNTSLAVIERRSGTNMQRVSLEGGWEAPFTSGIGDIYTFTTSLRGDAYSVSKFSSPTRQKAFNGQKGRLFPQASLDWRYPLFNQNSYLPTLIEPELEFVAAPRGLNDKNIPNEDSLDFEYDETNIFSKDRFPGLDRVDSGQRFNYGTTFEFYPKKIKSVSFFLGQSYAFTENPSIPQGVGIRKGLSDIIGNFVVNPTSDTKLRYRVLWDKNNMRARRSQVGFDVGPPIFRTSLNYLFVAKNAIDTSFNGREQIGGTLSSQFTKEWRAVFQASRDLGKGGGNLAQSYGVVFENECFIFKTSLLRTFYRDRDVQPDNMILFSFTFKTLGEVETKGLTLGAKNRQEKASKILGN